MVYNDLSILVFKILNQPVGEVDVGGAGFGGDEYGGQIHVGAALLFREGAEWVALLFHLSSMLRARLPSEYFSDMFIRNDR